MSHPIRYVVPNAVTSAGLLLGVGSVLASTRGDVVTASWFVLMCVLLDKLDGTVARLLKATSAFGLQLDSFSDFMTFGVAPAFVLHAVVSDPALAPAYAESATLSGVATAVAMLYVLATALRLAKFNVTSEIVGSKFFRGMPTTLCGAIVAAYVLTALRYDLPPRALEVLPAIYALGAVLMVSNFWLPKLALPKSQPWRTVMPLLVGSAYVFGFAWIFPEYLLGLGIGFAVLGFIHGALYGGEAVEHADADPASRAERA